MVDLWVSKNNAAIDNVQCTLVFDGNLGATEFRVL